MVQFTRLLVKPHLASPRPLPADVSTQRTKYKNHLTPMGWDGPLNFGRFKSVQHNQNTGHLYSALSDLLISYVPVSCRVAVFEYNFLGWISQLFKKTSTQLLTTHFLTSGPLLQCSCTYSHSWNAWLCKKRICDWLRTCNSSKQAWFYREKTQHSSAASVVRYHRARRKCDYYCCSTASNTLCSVV